MKFNKLALIELVNEIAETITSFSLLKSLFPNRIDNEINKLTDIELNEVAQTIKRWVKKYEL